VESRRFALCDLGVLFPARSGEKGGAKPVWFWLPGVANRFRDLLRFIRWKPDRKDDSGTFRGKRRPAHFLFHANSVFRLRKCLTGFWTFVYKCPVSNFGTALLLERVAGTAAGESELTSSLPVDAGASQRESEMKTDTVQARSLAIEATGDYFANKVKPKIRISGKWLERAGFRPGHRVQIQIEQPGKLTLHFVEQGGAL
jgi:hypothetical protein